MRRGREKVEERRVVRGGIEAVRGERGETKG